MFSIPVILPDIDKVKLKKITELVSEVIMFSSCSCFMSVLNTSASFEMMVLLVFFFFSLLQHHHFFYFTSLSPSRIDLFSPLVKLCEEFHRSKVLEEHFLALSQKGFLKRAHPVEIMFCKPTLCFYSLSIF